MIQSGMRGVKSESYDAGAEASAGAQRERACCAKALPFLWNDI